MKRKIIKIDENLCNGCEACIPDCPEGAIQMVNGKAKLVSDPLCDGLGACLGKCPTGALTIEERDTEAYDERKVLENILEQGDEALIGHLKHLYEHNEQEYMKTAVQILQEKGMTLPDFMGSLGEPAKKPHNHGGGGGCPGSRAFAMDKKEAAPQTQTGDIQSALSHWPIQMHLISPGAPYFQGSDILIAADCTAFSLGGFHSQYLKGKTLTIACPKLDDGQDTYMNKITALIDEAKVNTVTVMIMQVPCCSGLLQLVKNGAEKAGRKVPIKAVVVGINGQILREEWV